jgi:hypothetical protein
MGRIDKQAFLGLSTKRWIISRESVSGLASVIPAAQHRRSVSGINHWHIFAAGSSTSTWHFLEELIFVAHKCSSRYTSRIFLF